MINGPAGRKKSQRNAPALRAANSKAGRIDRREAMTRRGAIIRPGEDLGVGRDLPTERF